MCCPGDNYHWARSDQYFGHRPVAQAFANYITHNLVLHRHSRRHHKSSLPEPEKPLDLFIAHIIHASKTPEIVSYTALFLLASITQACQCRIPHGNNDPHCNCTPPPHPSKLSHILSRATTRTPLSRVAKSHWTNRHFFIGAFYLAIIAYKPVYAKEHHKELPYWNMLNMCGIPEEEIWDVSAAIKRCISYELQSTIDAMLWKKFVISVSEFDCPFARAHQRRLGSKKSVDGDKDENENRGRKRKLSLKGSISSFWKGEKASFVASDWVQPEGSVDCGPNSVSDESWSW